MRTIDTLVWHCTATIEGREFTVGQIRRMHIKRGFSDIGYHRLVHLDGSVSMGRRFADIGAHVAGHNARSLGFAYVGGLNAAGVAADTRTLAQRAAMERITKETLALFPGIRVVVGHRDLSPDADGDGVVEPHEWVKVCPCFDAAREYAHLVGAAASVAPIKTIVATDAPIPAAIHDRAATRVIQALLVRGGASLKVDGLYGPATRAALIAALTKKGQ